MKGSILLSLVAFSSSFPHIDVGYSRVDRIDSAPASLCLPLDCPPPVLPPFNRVCGLPDCSRANNRSFLFPHNDPTQYYQCRPKNSLGDWEAIVRVCGCETYFDYALQRCVHPFEWIHQCSGTPSIPPPPVPCVTDCPKCGLTKDLTTSTTTTTSSTTSTSMTSTPTTSSTTTTAPPTTLSSSTISSFSSTTTPMSKTDPQVNITPPTTTLAAFFYPCNCFCWCPCSYPNRCWFPCLCNVNNCSC